jgi:type II secretory pathway pseudopilin PulG
MVSFNQAMPNRTKAKMDSEEQRINRQTGFTLVETVISITALLVAVIGVTGSRYFSALETRKGASQITAARIALMLCESWRGLDGDETYDPASHLGSDLHVTEAPGPANPDDFTLLGSYTVVFDDGIGVDNYMTTLSWKDVQPGLRALNVVVAWASREQLAGAAQQIDGISVDKLYELTVYARTY